METNHPNTPTAGSRPSLVEKDLSNVIVGCFFDVYNELGYGFVEPIYARALDIALRGRGLQLIASIRSP
jgi:GxxExxY protein